MVGIRRLNYNEPTSAMEINHVSHVPLGHSLGMALVLPFSVGCFFQGGAKILNVCSTVRLFLILLGYQDLDERTKGKVGRFPQKGRLAL